MTDIDFKPYVVMIAQYFPPDYLGHSTRAYNAARSLVEQGCRVTVIAAFPHYPHGRIPKEYGRRIFSVEDHDGIRVLRTWVPSISHYTYINRLIVHGSFIVSSLMGLFRTGKMDVIVAMNPNLFAFFPALMFKLIYRRKIIRNADDLWPEVWYDLGIIKSRILRKILDWITKISYDVPVAITPVSSSYVPTLTDKYHVPLHKIFVIEHGVDTAKFYRTTTEKKGKDDEEHTKLVQSGEPEDCETAIKSVYANRREFSRTNTVIVYSGALGIGYDFEPVIRAAKILEKQPVKFIIRGSGTLAHDEERINQMIGQMGANNIELRTKWLSPKELLDFLNQADIFVLPMSFVVGFDKGLPTKLLEYQALGKPIICISNGEASHFVLRTRSGLVSKSKDAHEIADLIMKLAVDKDLANELGMNGYNFIQENLTLKKIGERFMKIIATQCRS